MERRRRQHGIYVPILTAAHLRIRGNFNNFILIEFYKTFVSVMIHLRTYLVHISELKTRTSHCSTNSLSLLGEYMPADVEVQICLFHLLQGLITLESI